VQPSDVEELTHGNPRQVVLENALRKARAVEGDLVLACDTEVNVDGVVFGKPANEAEAVRMLTQLSGRAHEVLGGLVLRRRAPDPPDADPHECTAVASTAVYFSELDAAEIENYVATREWQGRAGGYAIQGMGAALVEKIDGDFWNVVGLPVPELIRLLKSPC
jgi:septum formation protein